MKQLGFLVVSVSLLLAVVVNRGPESQLPSTGRHAAAVETTVDPEVAIGWALAGSLLASVLMGGLVYRYSLREFETWTQSESRAHGLHLGVSARTAANQAN
jgi:hypothetical protein